MRLGGKKPSRWGLSGGRMEFPHEELSRRVSITVKTVTLNAQGEILLVHERETETAKEDRETDFVNAMLEMERLITLLRSKGSNITWEQINRVLDTAVPKHKSWVRNMKRWFSPTDAHERKINPEFAEDWDPESEETKIVLTAIREDLEEIGLLTRSVPVAVIPRGADHKVAICFTTEIVSGKLKKESKEIDRMAWFPLNDLPPHDRQPEAEHISPLETMYFSHKALYLPRALKAILDRQFPVSEAAKEQIEAFLRSWPANPS